MKKIKKYLRVLAFVLMMILALAGVGIPIPMFPQDRFSGKNKIEQIDEEE